MTVHGGKWFGSNYQPAGVVDAKPDGTFLNGKGHPHLGVYDDYCGPHCDERILHEPGVCDSCDKFPVYQKAREIWGVGFTRETASSPHTPGAIVPDPAETARPHFALNKWSGNQPSAPAYMEVIAQQLVNATDPEEIEQAIDQLRAIKKDLEHGNFSDGR